MKHFRKFAIEWLCELTWSNIDDPAETFSELTDKQLERAIEQYFDGGLKSFVETLEA